MKRRYMKSTKIVLLIIASFLLFSSCGIPTYLYIDNNGVSIDNERTGLTYSVTVTLTDDSMAELIDKNTTPSIKLFYAYSTSLTESAQQVPNSIITLDKARTEFNSLYRNSNNGRAFSIGSNSAPALYLKRKDANTTSILSSINRFDYESDTEIDALVLGTFSMRTDNTPDDVGFSFNGAPLMDFPIPISSFVNTLEGWQATFTLIIDSNGEHTQILLTTPTNDEFYLGDYQKKRFLGNSSTKESFRNRLLEEDEETFEILIDEIDGPSPYIYIHLWASLFAGQGDFNNIVWSELQYIDEVELYNETP